MIMENSLSDMKRLVWKDIETIQQVADRKGFNRRLDLKRLKKDAKKKIKSMGYRKFDEIYFPARELMIHEHKAGKPCEPHMRITIYFPELTSVIIDCDMNLWDSFEKVPTAQPKKPDLTLVTT